MYGAIIYVTGMIMNCAAEELIQKELFPVLKKNPLLQRIDGFIDYIWGDRARIRQALSRNNMISEGVSEANVDYVIEEIKFFTLTYKEKGEIRSQCGYESMKLADFLWKEYCESKRDQDKGIPCESDIKRGLFVVAKLWNEPPEEGKEAYIEIIKRIDMKGSRTLVIAQEMKDDVRDMKRDVEDTGRGIENVQTTLVKINEKIERIDCKTDELMKTKQDFHDESNKGDQMPGNMTNKNDGEQDGAFIVPSPENASGQDGIDEKTALPEELKIYLAASRDEFQTDLESLNEFIEEQNNCQNAVRLKLQCCYGEGAQDVRECKYCYILVGEKVEEQIQEIYEQVYRNNHEGDVLDECVQLRLFLKNGFDESVVPGDNDRKELEDRYKTDYDRSPVYFSDINRMKLDILQTVKDEVPEAEFSVRPVLQFGNNKDFSTACKKCDSLQAEYEEACKTFNTDKSPEALKNMKMLEKELAEQRKKVNKMKQDIWDHLDFLIDKMQNKENMDDREVDAIESVMEYGDYGKADLLLCSEEWNREIVDLTQYMKEQKEKVRRFISARRTFISNLKTKDMNDKQDKIIEEYEHIAELSEKWQIEYVTLYEFAEYLLNHRKYGRGIEVGEHLNCLYRLSDSTLDEEKGRLYTLLGELYFNKRDYKNGRRYCEEAVQILQNISSENPALLAKAYNSLCRVLWKTNRLEGAEKGLKRNAVNLEKLAQQEPEIYEPVLSTAYNYIGIMENRKNCLDEAVKRHQAALKIRRRLAEKSSFSNPQSEIDLSSTYNNLAFVYKKMGKYQEAEEHYRKAIVIRERGEKQNPSAFSPGLALVYSNYATLLNIKGENKEAQRFCKKAYEIRHELMLADSSYEVGVANTLHDYGNILTDAGMYSQAKDYLKQAIRIREKRRDEDTMAYELDLAETYCCYAKLLAQMGDFPPNEQYYREAENYMRQACGICDEYLKKNDGYDLDKTTDIFECFAMLLSDRLKKYSEAEEYFEKAKKGWNRLTKRCREVFEPRLKETEIMTDKLQNR